jgi:hypothetical protein
MKGIGEHVAWSKGTQQLLLAISVSNDVHIYAIDSSLAEPGRTLNTVAMQLEASGRCNYGNITWYANYFNSLTLVACVRTKDIFLLAQALGVLSFYSGTDKYYKQSVPICLNRYDPNHQHSINK